MLKAGLTKQPGLSTAEAIVPKTLDVNVFNPPKLEVLPTQGMQSHVGASETGQRQPCVPEKWSQEMMWGLLSRLIDLGVNGVCEPEQLLQVGVSIQQIDQSL